MWRNLATASMTIVAISSCSAAAQVATWYWTVSDTGNGDGLIQFGESAVLTLWAGFDPRQDQTGGGFAGTDRYDIEGSSAWGHGDVDERANLLDFAGHFDAGELDEANNIRGIEHYQLPKTYGVPFNSDNPIALFFILWTPHVYASQTVTLDNDAPDAFIYIDDWGNNLLYSGTGGSVTFHVVPAPASAAAFGLCAIAASRRRR